MTMQRETSPFSALTYQEQQDRWLEWRSRQLDYRPAISGEKAQEAQLPPLKVPPLSAPPHTPPSPAPYRHAQLDQIYARHHSAARKALGWQSTTPVTARQADSGQVQ